MKIGNVIIPLLALVILASSCVSKKRFNEMEASYRKDLSYKQAEFDQCSDDLNRTKSMLNECKQELTLANNTYDLKGEQIETLKKQVEDYRRMSEKQVEQVGELTVLSKSANDNMKNTLDQLAKKDQYIHLIQAAKSKTDSINLALAVNLKTVLKDGIMDDDVDVKVDKTVVFINLSDKMLYQSGSSNLTPRAKEVLGKIAKIIESRSDIEVMVEGYTDNVPISTECITDNWDLSVKSATSVVRVLQNQYHVDPNKLIAAGRGEYNTLASNDTASGRATNRRTRIIILPKLDQFYDLLNPDNVK